MEHKCVIYTEIKCDGRKYKEFGNMTLCENKLEALKAFDGYNTTNGTNPPV